jgi:hypothetical protein
LVQTGISLPERDALRVSLAEQGWARTVDAVPAEVCDDLLAAAAMADWSSLAGDGYALDIASLGAPALMTALGASDLRLIRHDHGQLGLPPADRGRIGFILDLNTGWPSEHGGLLMFQDGDRLRGWRPERGALTLFDLSRPLILSVVTPAARAPRLAVLGRLHEA